MTQKEKFDAYLRSLDHHQPVLLMVKMGADGEPEWWNNQGRVMGVQTPPEPDGHTSGFWVPGDRAEPVTCPVPVRSGK